MEEEICMEQLKGFLVPSKEQKVCKLIKSHYGLKHAPKQWHKKFNQTMLVNGFKNDGSDKCVHIKITKVIICL